MSCETEEQLHTHSGHSKLKQCVRRMQIKVVFLRLSYSFSYEANKNYTTCPKFLCFYTDCEN